MIRGARTRLRAIAREDLDSLYAWWNDPDLWERLGSRKRVSSYEELEAWYEGELDKTSPSEGRTFAIDDGAEAIGTCWYSAFDVVDRQSTVGLYLGDPAQRGKGYGRDAFATLLGYLFDELGLHKARLLVAADNAPAIKTYRALGFVEEGRLRDHRYYAGRYHDFLTMGLLATELKR